MEIMPQNIQSFHDFPWKEQIYWNVFGDAPKIVVNLRDLQIIGSLLNKMAKNKLGRFSYAKRAGRAGRAVASAKWFECPGCAGFTGLSKV